MTVPAVPRGLRSLFPGPGSDGTAHAATSVTPNDTVAFGPAHAGGSACGSGPAEVSEPATADGPSAHLPVADLPTADLPTADGPIADAPAIAEPPVAVRTRSVLDGLAPVSVPRAVAQASADVLCAMAATAPKELAEVAHELAARLRESARTA
jgi:hypothetical protein